MRRQRVTALRPAPEPEVEIRALADYDTALGLDACVIQPAASAVQGCCAYCRAMAIRISLSVSVIRTPDKSTVTVCERAGEGERGLVVRGDC